MDAKDTQRLVDQVASIYRRRRTEKTKLTYIRDFRHLWDTQTTPEGFAAANSLSRRRYYALKAAWQFGYASMAMVKLRASEEARDAGNTEDAVRHLSLALDFARKALEHADYDRQRVRQGLGPAADRPENLTRPGLSKRRYLGAVARKAVDWQEQIHAELPAQHQPLLEVLAVTGCRPAELANGVRCRIDADRLVIEIQGAKTGQGHGHVLRTLTIRPVAPLEQALFDRIQTAPRQALEISRACSAQALAKSHSRAVARALGPSWTKKISLYSHRHLFAANLKAAGHSPEAVALALGHASDRTQQHYGTGKQGGRAVGLEHVQGSRAVKRHPPARERLGLDTHQGPQP